jgi:hypothetical protein
LRGPVSEDAKERGIPRPALAILHAQVPPEGEFDQAFPLLTVDIAGFPHVTLLSRGQLQPGHDDAVLLASVWGPGTRKNLLATRSATVVVVAARAAYYLKLSVARTVEHAGRLGVVLWVAGCTIDSAGADLSPLGFRYSAELAVYEGWDADAQVLKLLREQA